ncbi:MAG: hypothetical protein KGS09_08775 [Nitrospirae bacterium]|nr:hypothetical protein [Nitrospirota bacterium]MDE3039947.1 hypothetical protein [Nitrospirota bacterium]MDE3050327.1 hypothetical protein [Nitrospirota bacterium]MDE3219039.1 hypothetical protein [Nitrospirota bacterium]
MGKTMLGVFFGLVMVVAGASAAFAHQAGGVEVGDLETGSVVGQSFKELDVDAELYALELGSIKTWYPPVTVIDFKVRPGRPVLLKVTNNSSTEHGFWLTDNTTQAAPTVVNAKVVLKPGETKFIGIPTSDLFYATQGNTLKYRCHLHPAHVGGTLLMIK